MGNHRRCGFSKEREINGKDRRNRNIKQRRAERDTKRSKTKQKLYLLWKQNTLNKQPKKRVVEFKSWLWILKCISFKTWAFSPLLFWEQSCIWVCHVMGKETRVVTSLQRTITGNHRQQRGSDSFMKLFYEIVLFLRFSRYHLLKEVTVKQSTFKVIIRRVSYWKGWHHLHTCTSCQSKHVTFFLSSVPRIPWAFAMTEVCGMILCYIWLLVLLLHKHRYLSYLKLQDWNCFDYLT